MKIDESGLKPDLLNANEGTQRGRGLLEKSLRKLGAGRSILADKHGNIIAGNKTLEGAAEINLPVRIVETDGNELVVVKRTDLDLYSETDKRGRQLAYADNKVAELDLSWKPEQIEADFEPLDLGEWGFVDPSPETADAEPQIDRAAELNEKWQVKTGDLWKIGDHRLLCGDSTKREDVERVMGGEKADMLFTDPPYGVNYEGGHFHSGNVDIVRKREKLESDDSAEIYSRFLPVIIGIVDGPCYMWFASSKSREVYNALYDNKFETHALIIWHKTNATYAAMNAQYKQRHEPCIYFKPEKSNLRWCGASTEATVWSEARDGINEYHPTQKPVSLPTKAISNHTASTVLDCFAGSGTTLVACENLSRKCRAIEISPNYCAVILERMATAFPELTIERTD